MFLDICVDLVVVDCFIRNSFEGFLRKKLILNGSVLVFKEGE